MSDGTTHSAAENVDRWEQAMGDWSEEDPDALAWPHKDKQPVVADVEGELRMFHDGLLYPHIMHDGELADLLGDLGEPSVMSLSKFEDRFEKGMFEWEVMA